MRAAMDALRSDWPWMSTWPTSHVHCDPTWVMVLGAIMTSPSDSTYTEPAIAINRVYTRHGDSGHTKLVGGQRVSKSALRIEAFGCLDELNAVVGMLRAECLIEGLEGLAKILLRVQHELFNLGSLLATLPEDVHPSQPQIGADDVHALEAEIDHFNADLPTLRSFVLPGSSRLDGADAAPLAGCIT